MSTAVESTPADPRTLSSSALTYRPAIDGVRAIAVYLVVAFHAEMSQLTGGFIGVDTFFILSGYLVTRLIVGALWTGSFDIGDFYNRRIRRLLPPALAVLAAVSVMWVLVAPTAERAPVLQDVRSAALYFSNWNFAAKATDYFAIQDSPSPVLHFWSLSVEEQFYVLWPLVLLVVWLAARKSPKGLVRSWFWVAIALSVASLVALSLTLAAGSTDLAYYGTHTRAYQLLSGAALGIGIQFWRWAEPGRLRALVTPVLQVAAVAGLIVLSLPVIDVDPSVRGVAAASCALLLLFSLEVAPTGPMAWLLSRSWPVYLGKISYGTYLWHYPVTVLIRRFVTLSPGLVFVLVVAIATALAALSERLLEIPIRTAPKLRKRNRSVIAVGLALSLLGGLLAFPALLRANVGPRITAAADDAPAAALPDSQRISLAGIDLKAASAGFSTGPTAGPLPKDTTCTKTAVTDCLLTKGSGKKILLMGDSHAMMLAGPLRAFATETNASLALAATTGCPWQQALQFTRGNPICPAVKDAWYSKLIPEFDPDVIILMTRATDDPNGTGYPVKSTDPQISGSQSQLLAAATEQSVRSLAADRQRSLVVIEPVPVSPKNNMQCLGQARYVDECAFVATGTTAAERSYRALPASIPNVKEIDIDPLVCPRLPICDGYLAGTVVRKDRDHITGRWADTIAEPLAALLRNTGVF